MVARAFCGWFEGNIAWAGHATQHHIDVFRFHNITALTHRCDWFWNFESIENWCRRHSVWLTVSTTCICIYWKLYTIGYFNWSAMTWWNENNQIKREFKINYLYWCHLLRYVDSGYIPTLWQPGFCHTISFETTSDAHNAITIAWVHAISNRTCGFSYSFEILKHNGTPPNMNGATMIWRIRFCHDYRLFFSTSSTRYSEHSTASNELYHRKFSAFKRFDYADVRLYICVWCRKEKFIQNQLWGDRHSAELACRTA